MGSDRSDARVAAVLDSCRRQYAPDDRVTVFDVSFDPARNGASLCGTVLTNRQRAGLDAAFDEAFGPTVEVDLTVLANEARDRTVVRPVTSVRKAPAADAEQVTQLLYGAAVTAYDRTDEWVRVGCPDGYIGWVAAEAVAPSGEFTPDAVVTTTVRDPAGFRVHAGVACRRVRASGDETVVRFRTGDKRRLPAAAVGTLPAVPSGEGLVATARQFQGTPYEWGGMTSEGIDCSGLVWIAARVQGVTLPRDTDQQQTVGREVTRGELATGDLLFFPGHVAISLGGVECLHAYGDAGGVVINSLEEPHTDAGDESPSAPYEPWLDDQFTTARRLF